MPSLKQRSQFYTTLATYESAGVPRARALKNGLPSGFVHAGRRLSDAVTQEGVALHEAMAGMPGLFSPFERHMVSVGERTGRLDKICTGLSDWFLFVLQIRSKLISGLSYPLLVLHFAAVMLPVVSIFADGKTLEQGIRQGVVMLAIPWGLFLFLLFFNKWFMNLPGVSPILLEIPLIGGVIKRLNNARFFQSFGMALDAGIGQFEAVDLASKACTNPTISRRYARLAREMRSTGTSFATAYCTQPYARSDKSAIPELIRTGEETGKTAEMAERVAGIARTEAETIIERASIIVPKLLYLALAAYIGYKIISFYQGYYSQINELLQ